MKIRATYLVRSASRQRGITLIDCIVYIAVVSVVLAVGSMGFYRCWDDNKAISRNADDIVRTVKAGESWRADVRSATGPIRITGTNSEQTIRIPCKGREILYAFAGGEVRKQNGKNAQWSVVLPKVKSSRMQADARGHVTAWRWEVELESQRKNARVQPLFTFEVVPGNSIPR